MAVQDGVGFGFAEGFVGFAGEAGELAVGPPEVFEVVEGRGG